MRLDQKIRSRHFLWIARCYPAYLLIFLANGRLSNFGKPPNRIFRGGTEHCTLCGAIVLCFDFASLEEDLGWFRVIIFETSPNVEVQFQIWNRNCPPVLHFFRCQKAGPPRRLGPGRGLATSLHVKVQVFYELQRYLTSHVGDLRTNTCVKTGQGSQNFWWMIEICRLIANHTLCETPPWLFGNRRDLVKFFCFTQWGMANARPDLGRGLLKNHVNWKSSLESWFVKFAVCLISFLSLSSIFELYFKP